MATTFKPLYSAASAAYTINPENVATSATFIGGVESGVYSNTSFLDEDVLVSGLWTAGTTPTTNTNAIAWCIPPLTDDTAGTRTWPDVFDGTASAETVTSAGVLATIGQIIGGMQIDSTTSNRSYWSAPTSIAERFGGAVPPSHVLFVAHNSGVNSNTTAANHAWHALRVQRQGV